MTHDMTTQQETSELNTDSASQKMILQNDRDISGKENTPSTEKKNIEEKQFSAKEEEIEKKSTSVEEKGSTKVGTTPATQQIPSTIQETSNSEQDSSAGEKLSDCHNTTHFVPQKSTDVANDIHAPILRKQSLSMGSGSMKSSTSVVSASVSPTKDKHLRIADMPYSTLDVDGLSAKVPIVLSSCFDYIFNGNLTEGVFRVNGSTRRMREVTSDYALYATWLSLRPCVHDVAGIIKKCLREYLDTIGDLLASPCQLQLYQLYVGSSNDPSRRYSSKGNNSRKRSESMLSFKTANESLTGYVNETEMEANGMTNISEEETQTEKANEDRSVSDILALLESVAHLLATQNPPFKNSLFFYLLQQLHLLSTHENVTKMSAASLAIIFHPYVFASLNLPEFATYQGLLTLLVDNYSIFVPKYKCYSTILGLECDDLDFEAISVSSESITSPVTEDSQESRKHRRMAFTQRLLVFWDSYSPSNNKSKMFSLSFGSKERLSPKKTVKDTNYPRQMLKSLESLNVVKVREPYLKVNNKAPNNYAMDWRKSQLLHANDALLDVSLDKSTMLLPLYSLVERMKLSLQMEGPPRTKRSKRRGFISLFRSSSSVNSLPLTSPVMQPEGNMLHSCDDLLFSRNKLLAPQQKKKLPRLFMRLRRKV